MSLLRYLAWELTAGVVIALLLRRFVCIFSYVKGRSMMDSLRDGEILFALRRHGGLERFDVVLCRYPGRKGYFVKRVIGLPGERISMAEDVVFIDGVPILEDFPRRKCMRTMEEREIGAGEYFLMGDNRPCSKDSRSVGPIAEGEIIAVAKAVVFPFKAIRRIR